MRNKELFTEGKTKKTWQSEKESDGIGREIVKSFLAKEKEKKYNKGVGGKR